MNHDLRGKSTLNLAILKQAHNTTVWQSACVHVSGALAATKKWLSSLEVYPHATVAPHPATCFVDLCRIGGTG
jgi:hypothetical protein